MLKAIWPSIARMPNHLSPDAHITTSGMPTSYSNGLCNIHAFAGIMCYFLYWLILVSSSAESD